MFKFDCKISNRSKYWNLSTTKRDQSKCWNFSEKGEIDQMLFFYCQSGNQSKCLNLIEKKGIDQNIETEDKIGNQSKCWNLSTNHQIVQNVVFWVKSGESIKKLTFECNKVELIKMLKFEPKRGNRSNVDILLQKWTSIKLLEFDWKIRNWSEYWNLRTTLRIDQNVEIWVQNVNSIWGKQ